MVKITTLFNHFFNSEKASGFILICATVVSLLLANVFIGEAYTEFFHFKLGPANRLVNLNLSIEHWINDGLMTVFFLLIGLEMEREIYQGELSTIRKASLPVIAAIGGMLVPFAIYISINYGTPTERGYGIPMATDIAFALGILSLAGRVPYGLKVFLTAFAIIDDLGAIIIIAFFYTDHLLLPYLYAAFGIFAVLLALNRLRVHVITPYIILGLIMWYCMLRSGVHATISGVLLAFALPFGSGDKSSASYKVQHALHYPVAFFILPVFALANTSILIRDTWLRDLITLNSLGIVLGLVIGKPAGVLLACLTAVKTGISRLPARVRWNHIIGAAILGGIGFTMSIFITLLAFNDAEHINQSKIAILVSSLAASIFGIVVLSVKRRGAA